MLETFQDKVRDKVPAESFYNMDFWPYVTKSATAAYKSGDGVSVDALMTTALTACAGGEGCGHPE